MKTLIIFLTLTALAVAKPTILVTVRRYPDGTSSEREIDPSKRESVETFYDSGKKLTHKIVYKLDERLVYERTGTTRSGDGATKYLRECSCSRSQRSV